jgi:hypothetical protein
MARSSAQLPLLCGWWWWWWWFLLLFVPVLISCAWSVADIWYTDQQYHRDPEYLSLGVDYEPIFAGRSPLQMYADYMRNFSSTFQQYMGNTITEIQVGLGPAGEMRYPAYQSKYWTFPGVGEYVIPV